MELIESVVGKEVLIFRTRYDEPFSTDCVETSSWILPISVSVISQIGLTFTYSPFRQLSEMVRGCD